MYSINKITSNPTVDFAAEELKKYLRMMMPRCGEITIKFDPYAKDGFRLGTMQDFGIDTSEADDVALDDILHIDTDDNGGIISGSNPRSVLLAVYRYLTINGCRWLFPGVDGEFIPIKSIEPTKYHKMADSRYRGQCNEGAENQSLMIEAIDFTPKIGMNIFMLEFDIPYTYYNRYYEHTGNEARDPEPITPDTILQWKRQCEVEIAKRGLQFHDMGHGWTSTPFGINIADGWANSNAPTVPEEMKQYIAMIDGTRDISLRSGLNTNFCMSNPEARRIVVKSVADYAEASSHIDYLHVWLADGQNNHCECDECRKMRPSDWYVILMNEIDEELTARKLDTRIVLICYVDSTWPPEVEKIKNSDRFSLLVAAISRDYSSSLDPDLDLSLVPLKDYVRNKNVLPKTVGEYIAYSNIWKERCKLPTFVYEYHFWWPQFRDLGVLNFARIIHEDVVGYRAHGFGGIVEDGSQRSFFPTSLLFQVYAASLFDASLSFDEIKEDVFYHEYGEDWHTVEEFFREIGDAVDYKYTFGQRPAEGGISLWYNPEVIPSLERVRSIVEKYRPFVEAHKNMPKRSQTVSYRILRRYLDYCVGLVDAMIIKASGKNNLALEKALAFLKEFGVYELEMEHSFDQCISFRSVERMFKDVKDPLN